MNYPDPKIIRIGSQELFDIGDRIRFNISKVLLRKGYKFTFSIRDRILKEVLKRGKPLEVVFDEFPDITFMHNPIRWQTLGEEKKEVKLFKDAPMKLFYFRVDFYGNLTKQESDERQMQLV